ncbi:MAG TPA: methyl-accepting chemotaxis protein, partial [Myxococcaceae bacterium]|nr:methyl-accepting chemotaxis protein [Myxococcaceae bacterium]
LTYWMLARRQAEGAQAVQAAIEGLASGRVVAPAWVSTDEMGDLASGMNRVLERLRQLPRMLQGSASRLLSASIHLSMANESQQQSLSRQAAALQEAQVTSAEIKQTSEMASERAEMVLRVAERAEQLGQNGEAAIEQTLAGMASIREVVEEIQRKLARLERSATQIGSITQTVKSLADRSNMLAVNAAIEAVRSGEHGKGFAVLAREVRALANQSIAATGRIGEVLDEVSLAVQDATSMGDQGAQQISNGLDRLRVSGESLRELSRIAQENMAAVKQIAAAVTQQNTGLSQIFTAIGDLAENMDETLGRLEATQEAAVTLQTVSNEVTEMAEEFNAG